MASETKVGLIAGLTFIICFAVILANRGPQELIPQGGFRADQPAVRVSGDWQIQPRSGTRQHLRDPAARSSGSPPPAAGVSRHARHSGRSVQRLDEQRGITSSAQPTGSLPPEVASSSQADWPAPGVDRGISHDRSSGGEASGRWLVSSSTGADAHARLALLEQRLNELAGDLQATETPRTVRIDKSPPTTSGIAHPVTLRSGSSRIPAASPTQHYTVVSGDTLSKIAADHYGGRSMRFVNGIFDANRSVLSSPDQLRPGMALVLPTIEGATAPRPVESSDRHETKIRRSSPPQSQEPRSPFRWYQIKKNDRYVSIAREQLGDASRWREIHKLNEDRFPDPQLIRTGVRIRLPVRRMAASTERRR